VSVVGNRTLTDGANLNQNPSKRNVNLIAGVTGTAPDVWIELDWGVGGKPIDRIIIRNLTNGNWGYSARGKLIQVLDSDRNVICEHVTDSIKRYRGWNAYMASKTIVPYEYVPP
jgi:hypothetical protein